MIIQERRQYIRGQRAQMSNSNRFQIACGRLACLLVLLDIKGYLLIVVKACHARPFNGADMNKHVLPAAIRADKTEALL